MTVLGAYDTTFDPAKNFAAWQQLVSAHPDAKAFAGVCENDLNALEKIKAKDSNAKYFIESVGINAEALQGIKSGVGGAAIGQQPFLQGYVAMKMLLLKVQGKANIKRGWVDTGVEIVTSSNVDQVLARENSLSNGPADSLTFYKTTLDKIFADPAASVTSLGDYVATS
jgi:ribose transport system substrate-binding protein